MQGKDKFINVPWKPIGVYRTFPLPILPILAPVAKKAWVKPIKKPVSSCSDHL